MALLDIYAGLQFSNIAHYLGLAGGVLPGQTTNCPHCGCYAWTIYHDYHSAAEWYHCRQCKAAGSVLAMAADCLGTSEVEAINYLASRVGVSFTPHDRNIFEQERNTQKKFQQAWHTARGHMRVLCAARRHRLHTLGWHPAATVSPERVASSISRLFGFLSVAQSRRYFSRAFGGLPGTLVIVPYFRTPSEINSFSLFAPQREFTVATTLGEKSCEDVGFAGLQLLPETLSSQLIVTSMLSPMVMLQIHNFRDSHAALPLLAYRASATALPANPWQQLRFRTLTFWEHRLTAAVLHQAVALNAKITLLGPAEYCAQTAIEGGEWWRWIHHEPAADIVAKLHRNARCPEATIRTWGKSASPDEKTRLLKDAEWHSSEIYNLVRQTARVSIKATAGKQITFFSRGSRQRITLTEKNGQWYDRLNQVRLAGVLRITHLVVRPTGNEYVGKLNWAKRSIPFRVQVKSANWAWLENFALQHKILLHVTATAVQQQSRIKLLQDEFCPFEAACHFQPPEVVTGLWRVGWDGSGFQFCTAKLRNGVFSQNPEFTFPADSPGPPRTQSRLTAATAEALACDTDEMEAIWTLTMAVALQVAAPAWSLPSKAVFVIRETVDVSLNELYSRLYVQPGHYKNWPHRWPRRLDNFQNAQVHDKTNFFVVTGIPSSRGTFVDLILADLRTITLCPRLLPRSASTVILHYLRHLSTQTCPKSPTWRKLFDFTVAKFCEIFPDEAHPRIRAAAKRLKLK